MLSYPPLDLYPLDLVRKCGKMMVLDRILVKLFHTPHRVLLFSTMTKLLDVMEEYLRWRTVGGKYMKYARIDGSTTLEDREESIQVCSLYTPVPVLQKQPVYTLLLWLLARHNPSCRFRRYFIDLLYDTCGVTI